VRERKREREREREERKKERKILLFFFLKKTKGECRNAPGDCFPNLVCDPGLYPCWNGLCVSDRNSCEFVPSCPLERPKRCQDGHCTYAESNCARVSLEIGGFQNCTDLGQILCDCGVCADVRKNEKKKNKNRKKKLEKFY